MKVLVTGGAGYIGSHVVYRLIEKGHEVVVFDNLSVGHRSAVHKEAHFIQGDLLNKDQIAETFALHAVKSTPPFDGVMHFASHTQVGESMEQPFKYFNDNLVAVINLLECVTRHKVGRFILSSTANLFDETAVSPLSEVSSIDPGSVYGETKYMIERMLRWMDRIYGLKYCALRYFNASGAHPDGIIGEDHTPETHLIPLVLQVALGQREKISIFGTDYETPDGTAIRDYVHVMDLADAHILALEALGNGDSRVYNLGSGVGYSVKEVIDTCREVTGYSIPVEAAPRRPGDLTRLVADSSKIMAELGWEPDYNDLKSIVETAWKWHQSHQKGYEA